VIAESLAFVGNVLSAAGINYQFAEFGGTITYPYFVGEYTESEPLTEDGLEESTFLLTGYSRGSWLALETAKETIKALFINGKTAILPSGRGIAVFWSDSIPIPTQDEEIKRMEIRLTIKEWRI